MIKKIIFKFSIIILCVMSILALIVIRIREYQRDYFFQSRIMNSLSNVEENQKMILKKLNDLSLDQAKVKPGLPKPSQPKPVLEDFDQIYEIDLQGSPVKGDPTAQVTIVEFSDIQCSFSQRFHQVFMQVMNEYSDGVKYVFKNFPLPFHDQAKPAAKVALAAGEQGKYWEMLELLMKSGRALDHEKYLDLAQQLQLDVDLLLEDLDRHDQRYEEIIQKDLATGSSVNVRGTPTFFINGKKTRARTPEEIRQEISGLLK